MVDLDEARAQAQQARNLLEQKRQEAQRAEQTLKQQERRIPQTRTQQALRQKYAGLQGRRQRQLIEQARGQLTSSLRGVETYRQQLSGYETGTLQPAEQQIQQYQEKLAAYNRERQAIAAAQKLYEKGISYSLLDTREPEYKYLKQFYEQGSRARVAFTEQIKGLQTSLPSTEQLIVDWDKRKVLGVSSGAFKATFPVSDGQIQYGIPATPTFSTPSSFQDVLPSLPREDKVQFSSLPTGFGFASATSEPLVSYIPDPLISPTGKPYGTIQPAPKFDPLYDIKRIGQLGKEVGYFRAVPKYIGEVFQRGAQKILGSDISPFTYGEAAGISRGIGTVGTVGTYFTPAGVPLLIGGGIEEYATSAGRARMAETELALQQQGIAGIEVSPTVSRGIAYGLPILEVGLGMWGAKTLIRTPRLTPKVPQRIPLRDIRGTSRFVEVQRPVIAYGKPTTISKYQITREISPPTFVRSKTEGFIGGTFKPARYEKTITPLPVRGERTPFLTLTTRGGRVGRMDIVSGSPVPRTLTELKSLSSREQFLWQRLAESKAGRPVALENVPKILSRESQLAYGQMNIFKLGRVEKTGKSTLQMDLFEPKYTGRRITRYETVSEFIKKGEKPIYDIWTGQIVYKDVTKPLARATGKTPTLRGKILRIKEPIVIGEDTGITILKSTGKKTPFSKTFQEVKSLIVAPKPLPKPTKFPKTKVSQDIIAPTTRTGFIGGATTLNILDTPTSYGKYSILSGLRDRIPSSQLSGDFLSDFSGGRYQALYGTQTIQQAAAQPTETFPDLPTQTRQDIQLRVLESQAGKQLILQKLQPKQFEFLKEAPRLLEKMRAAQVPRQIPRQRLGLGLREMLKSFQKQAQKQNQKGRTTSKPKASLRPRPQPPTKIIKFWRASSPTRKKVYTPDLNIFEIFGKRFGRDILLKKVTKPKEAEDILRKFLKGTLGASGFVTRGGKPIKLNLGLEFRPAKYEPLRIVQKRKFRLGTRPEVSEIQSARKGKKSKKGSKKRRKKNFSWWD